jgi:transcriptional regulator with GAF, ATPase, and Fis domain/energy-coupling factor transporter ATP-binding protein EcfA2
MAAPAGAPTPPRGEDAAPFGRTRELTRLRSLFDEARAVGRGRCALVVGPAGIGKSHLLDAFKRSMRAAGEVVFEGRCRQTDHRPYGSLVELLGQAAGALADLGRPAPATERALSLIAGLPGPGDLPQAARADDLRLHFVEVVRRAVVELRGARPPVLHLHDLHRADVATLALIRYLIENLMADPAFDWAPEGGEESRAFRGLLVLSFREVETTRPLLELGRASSAIEALVLGPLDRDALRAYLQSDAVVERMLRASGGNPAALGQLLSGLGDSPDTLWARRFAEVAPEHRPILDALAVLGRPVSLDQLRDVLPAGSAPLVALQALQERGLVGRVLDRGEVRFHFAPAAARECWYEALDPVERAALHRHIAERLVPLAGRGVEAEEVATHYLAGAAAAEAVPFALAAADRLEAAFAHARAAELLTQIVTSTDGPLRRDIFDRLSELYARTGEFRAAEEALEQRAALAGDEADRATVHLRLARLCLTAGWVDRATAAVAAAESGPLPDALRHAAGALAAEIAWQAGDPGRAESRAEAGLAAAGDLEDAETLSLRNTLGKVHLARERLETARALFTHNLESARRLRAITPQIRSLINLGIVSLQSGEAEVAAERYAEARRLAADAGDLRNLAISLDNLAVLFHRRQDFGAALAMYHHSTQAFRKLGQGHHLAHTALNLAELYLVMGDAERARRLTEISRSQIRRARLRSLEAQCALLDAQLAAAAGDRARAEQHYRAALAATEPAQALSRLSLLIGLADLQIEADALDDAEATLARATEGPASTPDPMRAAALLLSRASLARKRGDAATARAEAAAAQAAAQTAGDQETRWRALFLEARLAWEARDRAAALQALGEAAELIERVARRLPEGLRTSYLEAPDRRQIGAALRRVRAGIGPHHPLLAPPAPAGDGRALRAPRYQPHWGERYPQILGRAPALFTVFNALDRVAGSDAIVLIRGESGTGKELVAAALHANSPRAEGPFVKVNCSAFVETLLLSELFGHEKGAFTGAVARKKGRFELADTGTLFLDEIGDISPNTQVALLRVLQEGTFERVGGSETLSVDVRVLCATHRTLEEMVRRGEFRADLYYRLRGVIIELPSLRDRRTDIPLLVEHFLARRSQAAPEAGGAAAPAIRVSPEALASLMQHDWPGNVRELENVVRSAALFADGGTIGLSELRELGDFFRPPDEQAVLSAAELLEHRGLPPAPADGPPDPAPPSAHPAEPDPEETRSDAAEVVPPRVGPRSDDDDDYSATLARLATPMPVPEGAGSVFDSDWLDRAVASEGGLFELKKRIEFEAIARALRASGGNITRAAERLGMKRPRLSQIIHAIPALGDLKREVGDS